MNYINGRLYFIDKHNNLYLKFETDKNIYYCSNIKKNSKELLALPIGKTEPSYIVNETLEELLYKEVN